MISANPFSVVGLRRSALRSPSPLLRVAYRQARVPRSGSTTSPVKPPTHLPPPGFGAHPESVRPAPRRVVEPPSPVDASGAALMPAAACVINLGAGSSILNRRIDRIGSRVG